jgi:hypothetical protein
MDKNWNCFNKCGKLLLIGSIVGALITGCGGGGGGGGNTPATSALSGVAAVGYPIVNATINIVCAAGNSLSTTTNSTGAWQVTLAGQTLPCAVQVSGGTINGVANSTPYHSIATAPGTVNVTPLTDLMVANLAGTTNPSAWFAGLNTTPAPLTTITQANIDATLTKLSAALSGLTPLSTINPITTAFTPAAGNTSDNMLTAMKTAMSITGISYTSLLNNASTPAFTAPAASFNTALTTAYSAMTSGGTPTLPAVVAPVPLTKGIRPGFVWEVSVTPSFDTYDLQLCYGGMSCTSLGGVILQDVNFNDTITSSGFTDGIHWSASSPVQQSSLNDLTTGLTNVLSNVWSGISTPSSSVIESLIGTALSNGTSTADVAARATALFAARGYPVAAGVAVGGYQCPTTKAVNDPDWIQSHGSYWAAASAHDAYIACLATNTEAACKPYYTQETQYCTYALPACLAVATSASSCPG